MIFLYLFWVLASVLVAFVGRKRKFGFWGYLFCSLFFTPLIGFMLVLASDAKPTRVQA
ncbi:MAG: putative membrane protein [Candidatus Latescibacterota bacterium]|jgi:uncharacterized membrane protein